MKRKAVIIFLSFFGVLNALSQEIDYKGFPQWSWHKQDTTEYYLYTPDNIKPGKKVPIALFMHGCCGTSYTATLRNCVDPPVRMWHNFGENTQSEPIYIISPATSRGWDQHFKNLKTVIDELIANHQGDPQRIYVTGFSMGGSGTWSIINQYPDFFAAAIPLASNFRGNLEITSRIPVWAHRGETDTYANTLHEAVAKMRALNGDPRGYVPYETGVNPVLTTYLNQGHVVQWAAASSYDLVEWALSKVNDGNDYPNVYFESPVNDELFTGTQVPFTIKASDNDGSIAKVDLSLNGKMIQSLSGPNFTGTVNILPGDNILKAVAFDDKGKNTSSTIKVKTNITPAFNKQSIPKGRQGDLYFTSFNTVGNAPFSYSIKDTSSIPRGLILLGNGVLKGIPVVTGSYKLKLEIKDAKKDSIQAIIKISIGKKDPDEVLVTNVLVGGKPFWPTKAQAGEAPNYENGLPEITLSDPGRFRGLTMINPPARGRSVATDNYISFDVDEDVIVYIAYEKKERLFTSTVPAWLASFTEEAEEIVAQYRYFRIFKKSFPNGKVVLPGADATNRNVEMNYFVLIEKEPAPAAR
jgi:pimeloyl-ACP methyl ester carboxylesterase